MPKPPVLVPTKEYQKLIRDIRKDMSQGFEKISELLEWQKTFMSWTMGRRINFYLEKHQMPLGGRGAFYENLSKDLEINERTLQQFEQFYRYFPKLKREPFLKWSHYRFLLSVPDAVQRQRWLERIKKEKIPTDELRIILMPKAAQEEASLGGLKAPVRGKLFSYRILRAADVENFDTPWFIDLGFASRIEAPVSRGALDNKYLYTSEKIDGAYRVKVAEAAADQIYTYRGKLRRVIDGDTLLVLIDLGFGVWTEQKLRLKGIDAPEAGTLDGERSKKWIADELKSCENLVVKTYKSDNWDRYLVDIFYIPKEADLAKIAAEGVWLNGRMVEAGMAKVWKA